ncbi:uncharacterized protein LOC126892670 [Diabrotica virgifera virgifera]|uniref:DUF7869 domain-containing protein n=1 Tax=Diabrotica virgifera virgifera TaxID=50390 RepID=A0ABM5L742_DIAVI|nr:uncharacterized protein LOC126892670 [Diabrotica virgifera virgifera]
MATRDRRVLEEKKLFYKEKNSSSDSDFDSDDSVKDREYSPLTSSSESDESSPKRRSRQYHIATADINQRQVEGNRGSIILTPEKLSPSRWRKVNIEERKKTKAKKRRNLGHVYISLRGAAKEAKKIGDPCKCKKKCRELLRGTELSIFNGFWDLETYEKQNTYLFSTIKVINKKRSYKQKTKRQESIRKFTNLYFVKVNGVDVQICKQEFLSVHGLQNSTKRIKLISKQISEGRATPKKDQRGKHHNRPNKVLPEMVQSVHDHIRSIPKYVSHYSRIDNPNRVYINHDLSVSSLYKGYYIAWCKERNIIPVKEDRYRRIFNLEYNIGFKMPKTDTCSTCDSLNIIISSNNANESEAEHLQVKLRLHQTRAQAMQQNLKDEIKKNEEIHNTDIISFDLQQTLPTPSLTVGVAFYLRKAWTYNLGIHDCVSGQGHMFMWTESVAKRGSSEIASVLLKYITSKPTRSENLVVFTDNCGGQNKNWLIMALWLQLVREKIYKTIEHRFLVSGHTHLPSDRDFALIEKHKKYVTQVFSPEEWFEIVRKSNRKNPSAVVEMSQDDFYSFDEIVITKKTCTTEKQPLNFTDVRCFRFDSEHPNSIFIKHTLNGAFDEVNVGKRGVKFGDNILTTKN